jgi:hypothetical protein
MKTPVLSPEKLREAAMSGRRSALYRWMIENYAEFSATIAAAGRPNWQALAHAFGEAGLRDRLGNVPSAEGTRQTWFLVRQAVAKTPKQVVRPLDPPHPGQWRASASLRHYSPPQPDHPRGRSGSPSPRRRPANGWRSARRGHSHRARRRRMTAASCPGRFTRISRTE